MTDEEIEFTLESKPDIIDYQDVPGGIRPTTLRFTSKFGILIQQISYLNKSDSDSWAAVNSITTKETIK